MGTTEAELEAKYAHNNKVMVASAILLLLIIFIIILFRIHLYLYHRLFSQQQPLPTTIPIPIKEEQEQPLHPSILKSLPTFTYSSAAPIQECAVCLSEFAYGDEGRTLPNCSHAFHSHCIDTWFASHSTCPLCRTPVRPPETVSSHSHTQQPCCVVSVLQLPEGSSSSSSSSYFPEPIGCPRKELRLIVEMPEAGNGSDDVPGERRVQVLFEDPLQRLE